MNGFFLIDKEQEWTSSDVVCKLRGVLHEKKIGHAGTLDPMATGLLIVLVGKGTKSSDEIMGHDKEYVASLRLGLSTDTQDIWGKVISTNDSGSIGAEKLDEALAHFTGEIQQLPPMYSAVKVKGKKLYEIARRGGEVEREPRTIRVSSIERLGRDGEDWILRINCSSGTYIRTLCNDIGDYLGCGGCMTALRRTKIGNARVEDAHKIGEITDFTYIVPLEDKDNLL